jgi:hypothetical protein
MRIILIGATIAWTLCALSGNSQDDPVKTTSNQYRHETLVNPKAADWNNIKAPELVTILELIDPTECENVRENEIEKLSRFPNLEVLVLGCDALTDQQLRHVLELKKLKALVIYKCRITDDGVRQLSSLPKIRTIGLFDLPLSARAIKSLQQQLPETLIELGSFNTNGDVFDGNGCLTSKFMKEYFGINGAKRD